MDHGEVQKLRARVENLQHELAEAGQKLGDSEASAEISRLKTEPIAAELSQLKRTMIKVRKVLLVACTKRRATAVAPCIILSIGSSCRQYDMG